MTKTRTFRATLGALFLAALIVATYLTIALFRQDFTSTTELGVDSPRAGLLMDPGAQVKLRGVKIGQVDKVTLEANDRVRLTLGITPDQLKYIPANVAANIIPPTLFGAKYVELVLPSHPEGAIVAGATITAEHVNVEVNQTFAHLMDLLEAAQPQKVNSALNALATALRGNGNRTGELIVLADHYLQGLNPALATNLPTDLTSGRKVADLYTGILPNLIKVGTNAATTSDTLVNSQATLAAVLASFTKFGTRTTAFLQNNHTQLRTALTYLAPTGQLLAKYSSIFPCTLQGLVQTNQLARRVLGGTDAGANVVAEILPADDIYTYDKDLPVVGADNAPSCYGLPLINKAGIASTPFNVGTNPNVGKVPNAGTAGTPGGGLKVIGNTLLGALVGAVTLP